MDDKPKLEKVILIDRKAGQCDIWRDMFEHSPGVEIIHADYLTADIDYDCVVAPGNSFGLMDGGFDEIIAGKFPHAVQDVAELIRMNWRGEQPVGTSLLAWTRDARHPWVAHTPTMRVPMDISNTDHVYLAFRAAILQVSKHNVFHADEHSPPIRRLLVPALGGGTGHVPAFEVARQMLLAYQSVTEVLPERIGWEFADARQRAIGYGRGGNAH